MDPYLNDQLALMAAVAHEDSAHRTSKGKPSDKATGYAHGKDRSAVNRWRNHGKGSPVYACLQYVLRCADPMRVAATVLSAARMRALGHLTTAELIDLYWQVREAESRHEHEDRALDSRCLSGWDWSENAAASERDVATDTLKASIERLFAVRRVSAETVFGGGR